MTWIKVTERLPEPGERVLCVLLNGFIYDGYIDGNNRIVRMYPEDIDRKEVIAWMQLPEYKEDEG